MNNGYHYTPEPNPVDELAVAYHAFYSRPTFPTKARLRAALAAFPDSNLKLPPDVTRVVEAPRTSAISTVKEYRSPAPRNPVGPRGEFEGTD